MWLISSHLQRTSNLSLPLLSSTALRSFENNQLHFHCCFNEDFTQSLIIVFAGSGIPSACSTGTDSNKRQSSSLPPSAHFKRRLWKDI